MFDTLPDPDAPPPLQQSETFQQALAKLGRDAQRDGGALWITRRWPVGLTVTATLRATLPPGTERSLAESRFRRHMLLLSPDHPAPWLADTGALPVLTPAHVAEWHLCQDTDKMLAALHKKWRNRLRAALNANLLIERQILPLQPDHWLFRAEADLSRQRGFRNWPVRLTLAFAASNRKAAQLFTASRKGEVLGGILVLCHGRAATYHIGHATAEGKRLSVHNLLLWHAAIWLASTGGTRFDLGALDARKNAGLTRFKLGTGARHRPLGGTWAFWPPLGRTLRPLAAMDRSVMSP